MKRFYRIFGLTLFLFTSASASSLFADTGCIGAQDMCVVVWECTNCNGQEGDQEEIIIIEDFREFNIQ